MGIISQAIHETCMNNPIIQAIQSTESRTVLQIANLLVMLASLWFFTKLAPITQQLALIDQRLTTVEKSVNNDTTVSNTVRIANLEQQYSRLENKIDLLIQQGR